MSVCGGIYGVVFLVVVVVVLVPVVLVLVELLLLLLVPTLVLVELELGLELPASVVLVPNVCVWVVSCNAVVPLELITMSLSCREVSGIVVSIRFSSVVVNDVKSGLVSESHKEGKNIVKKL